ncbi:HAD-IA family hydrolase [Acidisoma cellulosilytica]|uniref:HAD-IA family hydrolase n=2 Tax=Acidisoma cellulosilyticum TaxID=2802395 RepID=A0A964E409_9PROT|nr:HAD-IA family hydrolase [Acidisoma cellulosilyticum]
MTASEVLALRDQPIDLVIFDCDGVLIDSEGLASIVLSRELNGLGWMITPEECETAFLGTSLRDIIRRTEEAIGRPVPVDFAPRFSAAMVKALSEEVGAIPGAAQALEQLTEAGMAWRVASNSSHAEMAVKFGRNGMKHLVGDRQHSAEDMIKIGLNGKPDPHLFLAAAAAAGVPPERCVVIEDSVPGSRAAKAAGMTCLGFSPHGSGTELVVEGAGIFKDMAQLPALLGLKLGLA